MINNKDNARITVKSVILKIMSNLVYFVTKVLRLMMKTLLKVLINALKMSFLRTVGTLTTL